MIRRTAVLVGVTALLAGAGTAIWRLSNDHGHGDGRDVAHAEGKGSKQLHTCGMHPNVIQEGPGTCPICGMDLTPMKRSTSGAAAKAGDGGDEGLITIDPVVVQNMGVRVAPVKKGDLHRDVRTIGEVVVAEDLVSVVNLKFSGWIEKLYVDETGQEVRRGQPLFTVYSPELVSAQEEYLLALRGGRDTPLARSAHRRLDYRDLSERAIRAVERRGKALRTLTIRAPRAGFVLHKDVVEGARINAGQDLMRIGRLDAIWVHARVYEFDAPWVRTGQRATMELSFERGKQYEGKVSYIYPTLDPKTRTLKVRLEFRNPGLSLKPGMFATVRLETRHLQDAVVVPTEAILRSGERHIVFVAQGMGRYEPRQVVTGLAGAGHLTEVKSGLKQGEQVVVSGQFLLDSESQLQEAMQKLLDARLQAKQTSKQPRSAQRREGRNHGKTVWTCPMHPQIAEDQPGTCPICGMDLVGKKVKK
jgi:Cu(I)/Ag(I) efflux system membrane fusion protein/cobalt-zinc-cadmium efflux system membrane fusion protein